MLPLPVLRVYQRVQLEGRAQGQGSLPCLPLSWVILSASEGPQRGSGVEGISGLFIQLGHLVSVCPISVVFNE